MQLHLQLRVLHLSNDWGGPIHFDLPDSLIELHLPTQNQSGGEVDRYLNRWPPQLRSLGCSREAPLSQPPPLPRNLTQLDTGHCSCRRSNYLAEMQLVLCIDGLRLRHSRHCS